MKSINKSLLLKLSSIIVIVSLLGFIGYIAYQFYLSKQKLNSENFGFINKTLSSNATEEETLKKVISDFPNLDSDYNMDEYDFEEVHTENLENSQNINSLSIKYRENNFSNNFDKSNFPDASLVVIIIDDLGMNLKQTKLFSSLPKKITLSFLSYSKELLQQVMIAHELEHSIMLHLPMQPRSDKFNPGPDALKVGMDFSIIDKNIEKSFSKLKANQWMISGVNNHMGSKFTAYENEMNYLLKALSTRNVFFLDSLTTNDSIVSKVAKNHNVKILYRDIFIDNIKTRQNIITQLNKVKKIATTRGYAIALAHPYKITYYILKEWLETIQSDNTIQLANPNDLIKFLYQD